jgi:hypothetical protein
VIRLPLPLPRYEIHQTTDWLLRRRYRVILVAPDGTEILRSSSLRSDHAAMVLIETTIATASRAAVLRV